MAIKKVLRPFSASIFTRRGLTLALNPSDSLREERERIESLLRVSNAITIGTINDVNATFRKNLQDLAVFVLHS